MYDLGQVEYEGRRKCKTQRNDRRGGGRPAPHGRLSGFTLGDEATQEEHAEEMAELAESGEMMMHDEPNVMTIDPGSTKELTWHFTEAGTVLIGCHQVGHYESGMRATITVGS